MVKRKSEQNKRNIVANMPWKCGDIDYTFIFGFSLGPFPGGDLLGIAMIFDTL